MQIKILKRINQFDIERTHQRQIAQSALKQIGRIAEHNSCAHNGAVQEFEKCVAKYREAVKQINKIQGKIDGYADVLDMFDREVKQCD